MSGMQLSKGPLRLRELLRWMVHMLSMTKECKMTMVTSRTGV